MTDMHEAENLEALYGPLYQFSDHKRGDHLLYFDTALGEQSGTILWVTTPTEIAGTSIGVQYIIEPSRGGMPDVITPSDVIIDRNPEPRLTPCPHCGNMHEAAHIALCPLRNKRK